MPTRIPERSASGLRILAETLAAIWTHPENRGRRAFALGRYFAWQLWERVARRPWTVTLTGPTRIRCYPHSPIASAVIYYGLADRAEMRFLVAYLRPGDGFVDAGAHIGVYTLLACSVPGVRVLALEPSSTAYARAAENIALNGFTHRVSLLQQAAGERPGRAQLTVDRDAMNTLTEQEPATPTEQVAVDTLDNLVAAHGPEAVALVKIDVEGWEVEVLRGAAGLLRSRRPALIVEVNDPEGVERLRAELGYHYVRYRPDSNDLVPAGVPNRGENAILVADVDQALTRLRCDP